MSGLTGLNKGKRGEREVVRLLQPLVSSVYSEMGLESPTLLRNTLQSRQGGYDIIGLDWLALEVKFQENITVNPWWEQAKRQASENQVPVLIYRKSRMKWRVMMFGYLPCGQKKVKAPVDITLESFLIYFKAMVKEQLLLDQSMAPTKIQQPTPQPCQGSYQLMP